MGTIQSSTLNLFLTILAVCIAIIIFMFWKDFISHFQLWLQVLIAIYTANVIYIQTWKAEDVGNPLSIINNYIFEINLKAIKNYPPPRNSRSFLQKIIPGHLFRSRGEGVGPAIIPIPDLA